MSKTLRRRRLPWLGASLLFLLLAHVPLFAGNPQAATYCPENDRLFWFIQTSDAHVGASGTQDTQNLQWLVSQAKTVINPSFIVVTGDLTDSTNGNIFGYPNGPYQTEWTAYRNILTTNGADASFYYDIPGNHDAYNDRYFSYYLANSIQGEATGKTQASWTRSFAFGNYYFLGVNTADNTGAPFSIISPYGDRAGLDSTELAFIADELGKNGTANLTLVFGHHPLAPTGNSSDTYVYYGRDEFVSLLGTAGASLYGYGHTHAFSEQFYTQNMGDGIFYLNVASLGKSSSNQYTIMAVDCDGISAKVQTVGAWPAMLITAPMDRRLGGVVNPYAYTVPPSGANPLRALVFDSGAVSQVQYRIDGGTWSSMSRVPSNLSLWEATWNGSGLTAGEHTIEVQATGSTVKSDTITVYVQAPQTAPNAPSGLAAAAVSSSQINLSWADNSANETGFKIERCTGPSCASFAQVDTVGANVTSYINAGLSASTSYSYRIRAYNSTGDSEYSSTATAITQATPTLPAAPTNLTAAAVSTTQINLSWTDNSSNETGFKIERCAGSRCTNFTEIATVSANTKTYSSAGLTVGTTYRYRVRAYNGIGNSGYSNIASAQTRKR